jgi:hypothetical protein
MKTGRQERARITWFRFEKSSPTWLQVVDGDDDDNEVEGEVMSSHVEM